MKNKNVHLTQGYYWNKWVRKFFKLFRKIERLKSDPGHSEYEMSLLDRQMNSVYRRLSRMQTKVGIRIAGSAIALIMATSSLNAQSLVNHGQIYNAVGTDIYVYNMATPCFADIDGDGALDLMTGGFDGTIMVFRNNGAGEFLASYNLQSGGVDIDPGGYSCVGMADLDVDGDLDLYVSSYGIGTISVYSNDGTGVFSAASNLQAGGVDISLSTLPNFEFADIDNDGDLDLFVGNYSTGNVVFYQNNSGTLAAGVNVQAGGTDIDMGSSTAPELADIDGDGDLDLYVGDEYGHVTFYQNNGSGVFATGVNVQADGSDIFLYSYTAPEFADIDNDGDLDLYVGDWAGYITVYKNDGNGVFSSQGYVEYVTPLNFGMYASCTFADFDNDGDEDLITGDYDAKVSLYTNNGNEKFVSDGFIQADGADIDLSYISMPVFADYDHDNDLDLFVGSYSGTIEMYVNNGGVYNHYGSLMADGSTINVGYWSAPAFCDIDSDGDLDLFVGDFYGSINAFTNTGSFIFTAAGDVMAGGSAINIIYAPKPAFADMDYDGDIDLLVGDSYGTVLMYANDGTGAFASGVNLQASGSDITRPYYTSPAAANFDNDCEPDLYVANQLGFIYHFNYADTTAPVLTCPNNIDETLFEGQPYWTAAGYSFDPIWFGDNCHLILLENDYNMTSTLAGATFPAGNETVVWTAVDAAGNVSTCSFDVTINIYDAIEDLSELGVVVYPNPSDGVFTIENIQAYDVQISDLTGKVIRSYSNIPGQKLQIDLSDQNPGVFFITVTTDKESVTSRIVIE